MFKPKVTAPATPAAAPEAPAAPERTDEEVATAADEQRKRFQRRQGRASTMLSGGTLGTQQTSYGTAARMLGAQGGV